MNSLIGHGGCTSMRTVCNPFLFIVQIISLLPPVRAGCSGSCGTSPAAHDYDSSIWHAPELRASSSWEGVRRYSTTACAMDSWQTAAPAPFSVAISSRPAVISTIGHGGCTSMRTVCNPFLFIVQVRKQYGKCVCSYDSFLLVLPCPWLSWMLCRAETVLWKLLLLCGEIETNPGPDLEQIAKMLADIAVDVKDIKEKRLSDIEKKLDALSGLERKVNGCQEQLSSLEKAISVLETKIDQLENHSRRSNLIVYGLPEAANENSESLESAVNKDILKDIMELEPVSIERIHRVGRPETGKVRPVIFKLLDSRDKARILKHGSKLKNATLAIGEDFSPKIRDVRRKLWASAKANRDNNEKVNLAFDKLYIDNQAYVWDSDKGERIPVKKNDGSKTRPMTRRYAQSLNHT